jgi:methylase of polypeptide subunit release factors
MADMQVTDWLNALGYGGAGRALITNTTEIGRRPYAAELHDLLDPEGVYRIDAVFLVEDTPTVCFVDAARFPDEVPINRLRQRLWNQNLASALLVLHDDKLRAYSVPRWRKGDTSQHLNARDARVDGNWSASEFESSIVQRRLSDWFDPDRRVDRDLLRQLSSAVTQMTSGDDPALHSQLYAQMVMAQVMFISYLEHRGIIADSYRKEHKLGKFNELVRQKDASSIDRLLEKLKFDFNGDFLRRRYISWKRLDVRVLVIIDKFLSRVNLDTGQKDLWNYDFSQIPVELISGIYETFLQDKNKIDGAYYTPRVLAELAVEQALSGAQDLSTIRVYDGACGSGILLTTAYRKIVAYLEASEGRQLDINERTNLLRRTIFGSDINRIACRVTAFSLYLCLLERLTSKDLSRLRRDDECKLPSLIGSNILEGQTYGDFFSSSNSFVERGEFDVVISNPPWRELKDNEGLSAKKWALRNKVRMPHKQIAAAFASRAVSAAREGGRIVLLLPSSLITAPTNADFLRQFAIRARIDRLINLADFRRLLFAKAEHACTVLSAAAVNPINDGQLEGKFQYWMPKVDISFAFNRLTLHDYDSLWIYRSKLIQDNSILRRRSWGSSRDDALIARLGQLPNLGEVKKDKKWIAAKGYHMKDGGKKANVASIKQMPFLPATALNSPSPVVDVSLLESIPLHRGVASLGELKMYKGPRVLFPDGTTVEIEVRSAYTDVPFCFNSSVGGISFHNEEKDVAKFVACYLRSNLAKYWLILNGYSASAERARVTMSEIMSLPFINPENHPNKTLMETALRRASKKIEQFESLAGSALAEGSYELARDGIDEIIFDYFDLSDRERALVMDMVNLCAKSLQPTSYSDLFTPLQDVVSAENKREYILELKNTLLMWSKNRGGKGTIFTRCLEREGSKIPLDVVQIGLRTGSKSKFGFDRTSNTARAIIQVIQDEISDGEPLNFFAMPNSIFVMGNDIYIVKPARIRFWSKSAALRDADEIANLVIPFAQEDMPEYWSRIQ